MQPSQIIDTSHSNPQTQTLSPISVLQYFHGFQQLPLELRIKVLKLQITDEIGTGRDIIVKADHKKRTREFVPKLKSQARISSLLHVCHETRVFASGTFKQVFNIRTLGGKMRQDWAPMYTVPKLDTLVMIFTKEVHQAFIHSLRSATPVPMTFVQSLTRPAFGNHDWSMTSYLLTPFKYSNLKSDADHVVWVLSAVFVLQEVMTSGRSWKDHVDTLAGEVLGPNTIVVSGQGHLENIFELHAWSYIWEELAKGDFLP